MHSLRKHILLFLLLALSVAEAGKLRPLAVKDISLLLRSGYSGAAVERETAERRFLGGLEATDEKALLAAGASAEFVAALKSGAYAVPPDQLASVQEELVADAKRRAAQAQQAQTIESAYQSRQKTERAQSSATPILPAQHVLSSSMKGDLVTSKNGILSTFTDQVMENKKLIALYFSAYWCGPCRKFTPQLVEFYNRVAAAHPEFEIVFVSSDRSGPAMEAYMRDTQMPWPAINYSRLAEKEALRKYAGSGIPCLVLIDAAGKVVSDSYQGESYLGPAKVVADIEQMFSVRTAAK